MKHIFLILIVLSSFCSISYAVGDSIFNATMNRSLSFDERYAMAAQYLGFFSVEQQFAVLAQLASDAKNLSEKEHAVNIYSTSSLMSLYYVSAETAKSYLDTALLFVNDVDDFTRAKLYLAVGNYHKETMLTEIAHEYYYKSLTNFEKTEKYHDRQIELLYNIALWYAYEKDTANLKNIIEKMKPLEKITTDFPSFTYLNTTVASYYSIMYEFEKEQTHFLDSLVFYHSLVVRQYESLENPPPNYALNIAFNYIHLASGLSEYPLPDWNIITEYAEKAIALNPHTPFLKVIYHSTYASFHLKMNRLDQALMEANEAHSLLQEIDVEYTAVALVVYELLSQIHEAKKDFTTALQFERLASEVKIRHYNRERHLIVKGLQTRYEVAQKEESIRRLEERNRYSRNINLLFAGLSVLLGFSCIFALLWFRVKRKAEADKMKITKLQSYLEGLESERSRLAKEMHDHVSNGLLALNIKMRSSYVPAELTDMANRLQAQVREISHAMIPPAFQHASLCEIIDELVREHNKLESSCFQFYPSPEEGWEQLPPQTALDLYRIIQEACSNAVKHANAKNVIISLSRKEGCTLLSIVDDGCGFDTDSAPKGIGMQTINERAANQKGALSVISSPRKGTAVELKIENIG